MASSNKDFLPPNSPPDLFDLNLIPSTTKVWLPFLLLSAVKLSFDVKEGKEKNRNEEGKEEK